MVRQPAVAGMFYPSDPAKLRSGIEGFLDRGGAVQGGLPLGIIVPHAGYPYSGAVAGQAWARVRGQAPSLVVLFGPSHRVPFVGFALSESRTWETPLGKILVDEESCLELEDAPCILWEAAHLEEHSIEVQLPFLQVALAGSPTILPVVCGRARPAEIQTMAKAMEGLYHRRDGKVLFVCSTDLSHDYPYEQARSMDGRLASALAFCDADLLDALLARGEAEACGMVGLQVMMRLARILGRARAEVLAVTNSGEVIGDTRSRIVGYLSASIP
ncbi:MAG TPA: AmmeMemoRadiSam system protein B [Spirochaetota bacterium]|nr:AmmeMemoRadiSam system protein B [Spirochaetota bacterium]HPH03372.1 AmmeMemoRadiSam system protein B [Spirochaetota bacterium]HPN83511.1 AmmeMemoRadiSam system protein B [Spirochaetota bacterium]